ncbi:hypothetical protein [Nocardia sp. NPDC020380]|uniref:hypothetical protein n=1 Tax=Nocardia sp. NPDC020380 TaxID=3364309 RepID=UPI00379C83DE
MDRRTVFLAAGLAPLLAACGGGKHHDHPATTAPVGTPAPPGNGANLVMIIRHAEKPTGSGAPYGLTADGDQDPESLTVRGWTRAGALTGLFDPRTVDATPAVLRSGLARPTTIFAADPGSHGSKRPLETITPLAADLNLQPDVRFKKDQAKELVAALASAADPVLICWEHENIGDILAAMGTITPAPPKTWPGDRFDIVYVLRRLSTGWSFTQVPQLLLAGDSPQPIS